MGKVRRSFTGGSVATTTSSSIASTGTTSFTITAYTGWPYGANPFFVVVEPGTANEEKLLVTRSTASDSALSVYTAPSVSANRGLDGTAAAAHASGSAIYPVFTALDADEANELASVLTSKGDLLGHGASTFARVEVGSNNHVLVADSAQSSGVKWAAVGSSSLADGAVVEAKIADNAVTAAKIAADAVGSSEIAANAVGSDEIAANAVVEAKIASNAVVEAKIAANAVTETKIANGAVTAAKIASGVIKPSEAVFTIPGTLGVGARNARFYVENSRTISNVVVSVGTAPTGSSAIFDVNKNGTTIFSTQGNRPTIAASGFYDGSSVPDVTSLSAGDYLTVDVDQTGSSAKGADAVVRVVFS